MITAAEYRERQSQLLDEYEARVRAWLNKSGEQELAEKIPFFKDGVVNPEKWFAEGNDFRPLFILKEVSLGKDNLSDVDCFLRKWGNQTTFDFAENPFDDIKVGLFTLWRKIAALTKGLEAVQRGEQWYEYDIAEFAYKTGGDEYTGDIEGYKEYHARTANSLYNDMIERIAVLEVKKIGGGRDVNSELSIATRHYTEHIEPFCDLICREIELINPTVIICCSREYYTNNLLSKVKGGTSERLWIYGYHPTMNSTEDFYNKPLRTFKENIQDQ